MGTIEVFEVTIGTLGRKRTVRVYLPSNYPNSEKRYPVLYMHDGHNLFTVETSAYGGIWNVHQTLEEIESRTKQSVIVVGIDCDPVNRLSEYSPWKVGFLRFLLPHGQDRHQGGEGDQYLNWLVNDLMPMIDAKYRTNSVNYMAGSSMGGLISLYAGVSHPGVFKTVGCFSSAFWFSRRKLMAYLNAHPNPELSVYLDLGTKESKNPILNRLYLKNSTDVFRLLRKQGYAETKFIIEKGANHSEKSWARRFPAFVEWLLKL